MKVLIILGSESDKPVADKCISVLNAFEISNEIRVASAHRTPEKLEKIVKESDANVFIAIAGLAAALPGVVAAHTTKPVIGVPVNAKLEGLDALLSIMQMPPGIPVATVGVDRGDNAALLAVEILALKHPELREKLEDYRAKMREKVEKSDEKVRK
ncbi:MAG: 5-(carboxyamino)imidazole ribonucleotide mutase [Candidatus Diapherotrites archaeon]|nr:5-(carboxyamino)imidazole ribonucleotide mutase [Candidatus Diapherotrites archaeon]